MVIDVTTDRALAETVTPPTCQHRVILVSPDFTPVTEHRYVCRIDGVVCQEYISKTERAHLAQLVASLPPAPDDTDEFDSECVI